MELASNLPDRLARQLNLLLRNVARKYSSVHETFEFFVNVHAVCYLWQSKDDGSFWMDDQCGVPRVVLGCSHAVTHEHIGNLWFDSLGSDTCHSTITCPGNSLNSNSFEVIRECIQNNYGLF